MGYDIPGLKSDPDVIVTLTNPVIKGNADLQGSLRVAGIAIVSAPADINVLSGMAAASLVPVKVYEETVDCSAGGTAVTEALITLPVGSVILDIITVCTIAFDGNTTKTFEVGIAANTDKYIDPVDCPVTLAGVMGIFIGTNQDQKTHEVCAVSTPIIATWTNTAAMTAGAMKVRIVYA